MMATKELEFMTHRFFINSLRTGTMQRLLKVIEEVEAHPEIIELHSIQNYIKILSYSYQSPQREIWRCAIDEGYHEQIEPAYGSFFGAVIAAFVLLSGLKADQVVEMDLTSWRESLSEKFETLEASFAPLDQ